MTAMSNVTTRMIPSLRWAMTRAIFKHVLLIVRDKVTRLSWCFTSTEILRPLRDGEKVGKRVIICLSLPCHHQNDPCIKISSDESHFNVSIIVRGQIKRQCPQTTTFDKGEPKRIGTDVPLLTSLTPYRYAKPPHH